MCIHVLVLTTRDGTQRREKESGKKERSAIRENDTYK